MSNSSEITTPATTIIITDTTTIHANGEPTVHVKHYFDISMLEGLGLNMQHTLILCGIHSYFNNPQMIYIELIKMFWRNAKMKD